MTEPTSPSAILKHEGDEASLLAFATVLLRSWKEILRYALVGGVLGFVLGITGGRVYRSSATFVPQGPAAPSNGISTIATQLGINPMQGGSLWSSSMYVHLIGSRAILEPIARDTFEVAEERGHRAAFVDLLEIPGETPALRVENAVRSLQRIVVAEEDRKLFTVTVSAVTQWPSISQALVQRVLKNVNDFNFHTRNSQAAAERRFADTQATDAESALRRAEDVLQSFLQRNRTLNSPELLFERDRLQRTVAVRQQVLMGLVQSREDAKIREVRDTPVISVLEEAKLPLQREARGTVRKAMLGGVAGGLFGVLAALVGFGMLRVRRTPSREAEEFLALIEENTPRFLRRGRRR